MSQAYLQQEVEQKVQEGVFHFVLLFLAPLLLLADGNVEAGGKPGDELHDALHHGLPLVHDHGVLQTVHKLIVEGRFLLQLQTRGETLAFKVDLLSD